MPELFVESGPMAGRAFSFDGRAVIGRGETADVRVDDVTISRRHAEIRPDGERWEVADLGSANGTLLNDDRLSAPVWLNDGDRITLGQVVLRFAQAAQRAAAPEAALTPKPGEGGRVFQDLLSRVKLFCDLGAAGAGRQSGEEAARRVLAAVLAGFPRLDRAVLFAYVPVGDSMSPLAKLARNDADFDANEVTAIAREATRHQAGVLPADDNERLALTTRLGLLPLYGACAAMPLRFAGELVGALYVDSLKDTSALRPADREHLQGVAGVIACLIGPLREPPRDMAVERHDLTLAKRIQQRFLPQAPPELPGYRLVDSYSAARVIGGDHYDFLRLADGRLAVVVADVSGKAVSGALYMARLGAILKQAASRTRRAAELLADVNGLLYSELEAGMFVTMGVLVLEQRTGAIEIASAGHPSPLIRHRDGRVTALESPAGPPLGAMSEPVFESARMGLSPGDLVLMFTDGLDEAHNPQGGLFGLERVQQTLAANSTASALVEALRDALARFVSTEPQSDDLTIVALERHA